MVRTDNDSWEITESVGATALGVAAARAAATESENPLISDPFARVFLRAAGEGMWDWFAAPNLPAQVAEIDPDQPRVLDFKASTLRDEGAQPTCELVSVPVDLRHDWPSALQRAGFDAAAPSVWSAEGLLPFLPATAQELLFERVQALGARGSRIAVEAPGPDFLDEDARERQRQTMQRVRDLMAELQPDRDIPDVQDLWYFEEREDVGDWLRRHGWDVTVTPAPELMAGYDRRPPQDIEGATPQTLFVSAQRTGRD